MTAADVVRFLVIIGLGVLAFVTFLVAGTIVGLMFVEGTGYKYYYVYPVGLWILGLLGAMLLTSMIRVGISDAPPAFKEWLKTNQRTVVLVGIAVVIFLVILI